MFESCHHVHQSSVSTGWNKCTCDLSIPSHAHTSLHVWRQHVAILWAALKACRLTTVALEIICTLLHLQWRLLTYQWCVRNNHISLLQNVLANCLHVYASLIAHAIHVAMSPSCIERARWGRNVDNYTVVGGIVISAYRLLHGDPGFLSTVYFLYWFSPFLPKTTKFWTREVSYFGRDSKNKVEIVRNNKTFLILQTCFDSNFRLRQCNGCWQSAKLCSFKVT